MGGLGSGKSYGKGRSVSKGWKMLTTTLPELNISQLVKLHKEGGSGKYVWGKIPLTIEGNRIFLDKEEVPTKTLTLVEIPCHYGGFRYSVFCPTCNKRVKRLYLFKMVLGCRHCLKLAYPSQNQTKFVRLLLKESDIGKKINKGESKPKWMRWKTFERLRKEYMDLDEKGQIADFFSLRNNRQVNKVFEEYGCAIFAAEAFAMKYFGGGLG